MTYTFPDYIVIKEDGFGREEGPRFMASTPAAGPSYRQIVTDDAPLYFTLALLAKTHADALNFRQWLIQNNYDILNGAQFRIPLWTEYGLTMQLASFTPDGAPQQARFIRNIFEYSARIVVPRLSFESGPILTEVGDDLLTESSDQILTEGA